MVGDLAAAETVSFRYDELDIMCIETLELATPDGSMQIDIIQVIQFQSTNNLYGWIINVIQNPYFRVIEGVLVHIFWTKVLLTIACGIILTI